MFTKKPWYVSYGTNPFNNKPCLVIADRANSDGKPSPLVCMISDLESLNRTDTGNAQLTMKAPELYDILKKMTGDTDADIIKYTQYLDEAKELLARIDNETDVRSLFENTLKTMSKTSNTENKEKSHGT